MSRRDDAMQRREAPRDLPKLPERKLRAEQTTTPRSEKSVGRGTLAPLVAPTSRPASSPLVDNLPQQPLRATPTGTTATPRREATTSTTASLPEAPRRAATSPAEGIGGSGFSRAAAPPPSANFGSDAKLRETYRSCRNGNDGQKQWRYHGGRRLWEEPQLRWPLRYLDARCPL